MRAPEGNNKLTTIARAFTVIALRFKSLSIMFPEQQELAGVLSNPLQCALDQLRRGALHPSLTVAVANLFQSAPSHREATSTPSPAGLSLAVHCRKTFGCKCSQVSSLQVGLLPTSCAKAPLPKCGRRLATTSLHKWHTQLPSRSSICVPSESYRLSVDLNFHAPEAIAMPVHLEARPELGHRNPQ